MTPYIADGDHHLALKFANDGYVYVSVDRRGRGNSEGEFNPLEDSGLDGYDVIAWLAKQPWSNGQIAMRGGSYRGMVQWKIMAEHPQHLISTVPTAPVYPGHTFPKTKNIFMSYMAAWLAFTNTRTGNTELFGARQYWSEKYQEIYMEHLPFRKLDSPTATNSRIFHRWLDHPSHDAYWQSLTPSAEDYAGINMPILTITGHFDADQPEAMRYYREHMQYASSEARDQHYLLMGPWSHGGTRNPAKELGGFTFGDNSVLDMDQLQIDWFDWVLKSGEKPEILKDRVNFYVMGDQQWRHVNTLEELHNDTRAFYLTSENSDANDVFHSGILSESIPPEQNPDTFVYDPLDTSAVVSTPQGFSNRSYLNQTVAFDENVLVYHSSPLAVKTTLSGVIKFTAYLSTEPVNDNGTLYGIN